MTIKIKLLTFLVAMPLVVFANEWQQTLNDSGVLFGVAVEPKYLDDPVYVSQLTENFNAVTPENAGKWVNIHPKRKRFDFEGLDTVVAFAEAHNMPVRGHTLVWHNQNPGWLTNGMWLEQEARDELYKHIDTVVGRYKGRIARWDVVNEALDDNGDMRGTQWYYLLGKNYIADAFNRAHRADPNAILYYNDYGISDCGDKANAAYQLMKDLLDQGVPVHGIGFQGHYEVKNAVDLHCLNDNVNRMGELGLEVQITELDIRLDMADLDDDLLDSQAEQYQNLMGLLVTNPYLNGITFWGLSDKHSWIPSWFRGQGSALLFDEQMQPKPVLASTQHALTTYLKDVTAFQLPARRELTLRSFPVFGATQWTTEPQDLDSAWQTVPTYPIAFNQLNPTRMAVKDADDIYGRWQVAYAGTSLYGRLYRQDDITAQKNTRALWENDCVEVFIKWHGKLYQFRTQVGEDFAPLNFPGQATARWNEDGSVLDFKIQFNDITELKGETLGWNLALADVDTNGGSREAQLYPVPGANKSWVGKDLAEIHFKGQNRPPSQTATGVVAPINAMYSEGGLLPENTRHLPEVPVSFGSEVALAPPTVMFTWDHSAITAHVTPSAGLSLVSTDLRLRTPAKVIQNTGKATVGISMDAPFASNLFFRLALRVELKDAQGEVLSFEMAPENGFFDLRTL